MSDNIPFEIQIEIIKRFPVKSLLQFRKVSKTWKSLIDSKHFITDYTDQNRNTQQQHLLIRYINLLHYKHNISIVDDDTFPQHIFPQTVPESVNLLDEIPVCGRVVGSSNGLFCFVPGKSIIDKAVIWNPSIRKSVVVTVPYRYHYQYGIVGFGVCPNTNDAKIVKITIPDFAGYFEERICRHWQVDVFSLNSGIWRNPLGDLLSKDSHIVCIDSHVAIDTFMYWSGSERIYSTGYCFSTISIIISFDMTSETFMPIYLPDKLARHYSLPMFKVRESLALVECKRNADDEQVFKVWVMENGVSNLFKKLYTVKLPFYPMKQVVGLRKNYGLLMESRDDDDDDDSFNDDDDDDDDDDDARQAQLVVYEPSSKQINNLGIYGNSYSFCVSSYTESLLLLNKPNTIIGGHVEGNGD